MKPRGPRVLEGPSTQVMGSQVPVLPFDRFWVPEAASPTWRPMGRSKNL